MGPLAAAVPPQNLTAHLGNDTLHNMNLRSAAAEKYPPAGQNPAGTYDEYNSVLYNKVRRWEKNHTAQGPATHSLSLKTAAGQNIYEGAGGCFCVQLRAREVENLQCSGYHSPPVTITQHDAPAHS